MKDFLIISSRNYLLSRLLNIKHLLLFWLPGQINFEYLEPEEKRGFDTLLKKVEDLADEIQNTDVLYFYCHKCEEVYPQSKNLIKFMLKKNIIWWHCPVCGYQVHLEEAYKNSRN
jgi:rubrerythrin